MQDGRHAFQWARARTINTNARAGCGYVQNCRISGFCACGIKPGHVQWRGSASWELIHGGL